MKFRIIPLNIVQTDIKHSCFALRTLTKNFAQRNVKAPSA